MSKAGSPGEFGGMDRLVAAIRDYAIYMLSPAGQVVSWNAGAERFKGYSADEIIGRHFSTFHTAQDQAAGIPEKALAVALAEGKFECEGWRVRKDGTRFWASVVIEPVYADDGHLLGFAKITRDISEKKMAADALFASEQQFRILVQGVVDYAIYMLSPDGIVTNWNSGAKRIKGYDAQEIVGSHFSKFYTQEDREKGLPQHALQQASAEGHYEAEAWRVRKDGSHFWAHVVIDALRGEDGHLIGFAKVTRDNTARREAEKSLDQAREELFQAQKMEAIGQLTGGVAHDFNNLLSIISNAVQVLDVQKPALAQRSVLDSIHRAVARGAGLTQQLLAFARQQPLVSATYHPNKIIKGFENVLRRGISSAIDLRLDLGADACCVEIDEARFEAALLNLVVNARDAMPAGGTLTIATRKVQLREGQHKTLDAGAYVQVTVSDTGDGMPPEVLARAFEPFFTTKPVGKGTGLGLSQVQGFIAQSGGAVEVESSEGKGCRVHIFLPASTESVEQVERAADAEIVLIVEDEAELGKLAGSLFETLGYQVMLARNGHDALELLADHPSIDVLFTDVMMPGMTGIELARSAIQRSPKLKIIIASGYPMPALKLHGDIDDFSFVAKPYRLSEIIKKLR